jgi:hypothetical protein
MDLPQQLSLHRRLELDHGRIALITFREWEKVKRLLARYSNHLHFNLHCKHHNITPVSLRLKTSIKGETARKIICQTERKLMSLRIKETLFKIDCFKAREAELNEELFTILPNNMYCELHKWVTKAGRIELEKCRQHQSGKFHQLFQRKSQTAETHKIIIKCATRRKRFEAERCYYFTII